MSESYFKLKSPPHDCPLAFDIESGKCYLNKDQSDPDSVINLANLQSVADAKTTLKNSRPAWLKEFFGSMDTYVADEANGGKARIDPDTGLLEIDPKTTTSELKSICSKFAFLFEAQARQNKEILIWIGEIILDYIARASGDCTVEEAIDALGLCERQNGVKWSYKTLFRFPLVAQRIPASIRQLPIPVSYLCDAAAFSMPEDPKQRVMFSNARDAMLLSVAENPDVWSRTKFCDCMKELQQAFGMERMRNEGISSLRERLIAYYRLRHLAIASGDPKAFYANQNMNEKEVSEWIYNIEAELISREKLNPDPLVIPTGDGLTQAARDRLAAKQKP